MSLDAYKSCPCGSGKKVKFCCSSDMIAELDKVVRAAQGEQRVAALEQLNRLLAEKGLRPALLALKADIQIAQQDWEAAAETVKQFQEAAPYNPVAFGFAAMMEATLGDVFEAIEELQRALEFSERNFSIVVYRAIGSVANRLIQEGEVIAARGHLMLQIAIAGDQDGSPAEQMISLNMSAHVHPLMKSDFQIEMCPEDVPWRGEFSAALNAAEKGSWLAACESLESLANKVGDQPAILRNIAVLRSWLAQSALAVAAWRRYSQLEAISFEDAVEAEAVAQLIEPPAPADEYDEVTVTYPVRESDKLMETLLSHPQVVSLRLDPARVAANDEPPPKGVFLLLDRPALKDAENITREAIPIVVGELALHGKQTQRDARLELDATKDENFPETKAGLNKIMGDLGGPPSGEKKRGSISAVHSIFNSRWHLPPDVGLERRLELMQEQHQYAVTEQWPHLKLSILDRKRPVDVVGDDTYQVKLLAAILLIDLLTEASDVDFDLNQLRAQLQLPLRESVRLSGDEIMEASLPRLAMIELDGLSDDDLVRAFRKSVFSGQFRAVSRFGEEILRRKLPDSMVPLEEVYGPLIQWTRDRFRALELCTEAQQALKNEGRSPAQFLLLELSSRLSLGQGQECERIVGEIQANHMHEEGIGEQLVQLLVSFGVITPDGQVRPPSSGAAEPVSETTEPAGIWTPGSDAAAAQGEAKSKLWVPGMD